MLKKSFIIMLVAFVVQTISACCECDVQSVEFTFSDMQIKNLNNTRGQTEFQESNLMYKEAVAFHITVLGNDDPQDQQARLYFPFFSMNKAYATSCYCPTEYYTSNKINEIKIKTLLDINSEYPANSTVTDLFYGSGENWYSPDYLYEPLSTLQHKLETTYSTNNFVEFAIFMNTPVENNTAQFEITIILERGETIVQTTDLIEIIEP